MALEELHLHHFRNITAQKLFFSRRLNLIFGLNGSGKTSLLEAIYYLSTGRSFRTSKHSRVIQEGSSGLTVFGRISEGGTQYRLGIERLVGARESNLHRNGLKCQSVAELARVMPVSVIEPGTFELVSGGPGHRRRFLDWLVFHVEHDYGRRWKACQRAIRQRNQCLRRGIISDRDLAPWNDQVASLGEAVTGAREKGFALFKRELDRILSVAEPDWTRRIEVGFARGWDSSKTLGAVLSDNPQSEKRAGFTLHGPNRADMRILCGNRPAGDVLSRGQQRSLVVLMKLAQMRVLREECGIRGVCLLDDINAELDGDHQRFLAGQLMELGCQLFVTSIASPDANDLWSNLSSGDFRMFHVEHGQFAEQ